MDQAKTIVAVHDISQSRHGRWKEQRAEAARLHRLQLRLTEKLNQKQDPDPDPKKDAA